MNESENRNEKVEAKTARGELVAESCKSLSNLANPAPHLEFGCIRSRRFELPSRPLLRGYFQI